MSVVTLFTRKPPTLGGGDAVIEFDAIIEDRLSASIEYTRFPIEIGAMATDHGIVQPIFWSLRGAVSNNPLFPSVTDFAGGVLSNFFDSGVVAAASGMSAGFLAGSDQTRAGATLGMLLSLMIARAPFDVSAGDIDLTNMVIKGVSRVKNATNENGLMFDALLMELPTIATTILNNQPRPESLPDDDPAKTQAAADADRGETLGKTVSDKVQSGLGRVFGV